MIDLALETVVESLIARWSSVDWDSRKVGIEYENTPPKTARNFYVSVNESGETETSVEGSAELRERMEIEVAVWRQVSEFPVDRLGEVMMYSNAYRATANPLNTMQRRAIAAIHQQYPVMNDFNSKIEDLQTGGDLYGLASLPLKYRGRSRTENLILPESENSAVFWLGRRLMFSGFDRTQDDLTAIT